MKFKSADKLLEEVKALKIPGSYEYLGACSVQICIPLRNGKELRFGLYDDDVNADGDCEWQVDVYEGVLPPGITGPARRLG